ncbi:hypothetical protein DFH08DRAFT_1001181 [Mycena albidolilacea]|uniref:HMG box domain-containing protein n=1 Tax=Mycena albidolilacea TaxID=1033008 RepID=A0AAD7ERE5_9AGAR|nr:hypothetical protein DFH08DRAFT_1001181 [Mycena albidolilacea]
MHYHTASPQSDDYDDVPDEHSALTSQTLNPDGTPKRPMNAFMIFARRRRPQVSAEHQSMRTGEISKILSTEWKAMLPSEKQFYLAQAKQLKDTFNKKYPEYVYRRRPNNTRKKRPSASSASANAPSPDDAESNSSPDADAHPALPDPSSSRYPSGPYDQRHYSSPYASSSFAGAGGSYGGGGGYGHARTQSYNPYPPSSSGDAYRYESPRSQQLLNSPYYPPYDHNAPLPSAPLHGAGGLGSPNLGLRKAHSMASMPSGALSPPLGHAHHHHTHSASSASTSTSHPHSPLPSSPYYPGGGAHAQTPSYSPPLSTRYSPYASASSSHSSSHSSSATSASPVPAPHSTAYTAGSPPAQYGDYPPSSTSSTFSSSSSGYSGGSPYGAPRALTLPNPNSNSLGLSGGGLGMGGGLGVGVGGEDFYWRADKLL